MSVDDLYSKVYERSLMEPEEFWGEAANAISWTKKWDKVLDETNKPFYRWFTGAEINTCYNAVDFHVENGRGNQAAIIYDSPVTGTIKKITYKELQEIVSRFAGVLKACGVEKGDRVVIYMPMIPEAVAAIAKTKELLLMGDTVSGDEACRIGLVNKTVPKDELQREVKVWAKKLASKPRVAVGLIKNAIDTGANMDLASAITLENECFTITYASEDGREGMAAFAEKRKPVFKGK
jgi:hypothetical protein